MDIKSIKDLATFFELIEKLDGEVYLKNENEILDLKSKLSQFLVVLKLDKGELGDMKIEFSDKMEEVRIKEKIDE